MGLKLIAIGALWFRRLECHTLGTRVIVAQDQCGIVEDKGSREMEALALGLAKCSNILQQLG